tara:strand:+ start:1130 stop:1600 length:471 start_codon:yes stop_codon:yes gene_type:complete
MSLIKFSSLKTQFLLIALIFSGVLSAQSFKIAFDHTAVQSSNLENSAKFYKDILKLEEIPTPADNPKLRWFSIGDNHQLHLIDAENETVNPQHKAVHFSLHVDNLDNFIKYIESKGVDYINWLGDSKSPSIRPDGVKQVYVKDPDGYWIEINDATY